MISTSPPGSAPARPGSWPTSVGRGWPPTRWTSMRLVALLEATAALGPPEDIERELTAWQNRLPMEARGRVGTSFRAIGLYESGKLAGMRGALPPLHGRGPSRHSGCTACWPSSGPRRRPTTRFARSSSRTRGTSWPSAWPGSWKARSPKPRAGSNGARQAGHDGARTTRRVTAILRASEPPPLRRDRTHHPRSRGDRPWSAPAGRAVPGEAGGLPRRPPRSTTSGGYPPTSS